MIPSAFGDRLQKLGLDMSLYEKYPRKAVHIVNNEDKIVSMFDLRRVPWAEHCYWTDEPKKIQDTYYESVFVQDACSVVPVIALDVGGSDTILDLCAAPGSKTLHLARNARHVIAVDVHRKRVRRLEHNLMRFNIHNCTVLRADGRKLRLGGLVDKVLVDAPCSGEGMVGKLHKVLKVWSLKRIKRLQTLQKQLVMHGFSLLKEGGILVYTTCTFAPEENEAVIDYVLKKRNVTVEQMSVHPLQYTYGLPQWEKTQFAPVVKKAIRIYPHHNGTNGFFVAKLYKR